VIIHFVGRNIPIKMILLIKQWDEALNVEYSLRNKGEG
jgi:hypothetical protein